VDDSIEIILEERANPVGSCSAHAREDARAHNALAVALAQVRHFQQALAALEVARRLEPNNTLFNSNLTCVERHLQGCVLTP
jgi:hypothetical protein